MIRIGSMPTFVQKSSSAPSTTSSPAARVLGALSSTAVSGSGSSVVSGSASGTSSSNGSANSAAAASDTVLSTSGMLTISSTAPSTSSQPRPTMSAMACQRLSPALPVKWSMPPLSEPSVGLPLKNFITAGSSHTDPIDETIVNALASVSTDSAVGLSETSSLTA